MTGTVIKKRWVGSMLLITAAAVLWLVLPVTYSQAATNGRIAYETNVHGTQQIYTMNPDGSDKTRVAAHVGYNDQEPGIAPDGSRIAFISDLSPVGGFELFTMGVDGSGLAPQLTSNGVQNHDPEYSPDGTRITFRSIMDGGSLNDEEIYVVNSNGTGLDRLTNNDPKSDTCPSFSPDGTKIVFDSDHDGADYDIWVMNVDGSNRQLLYGGPGDDRCPKYSPDGSRIVFHSDQEGGGIGLDKNEIYTIPSTPPVEAIRLTNNSVFDTNPVYSPDGTRIAFDTARNGGSDIYTMDTNGGNLVQLTSGTANEQYPSWANAIPIPPPIPDPPPPDKALSIRCTSPKLAAGKTKRMSRKRLARYMKSGFKCVIENPSNVTALGASLVREKKVRKKKKSSKGKKAFVSKKKKKKKRAKTRCYRFDKPRTRAKCKTTKSDGLTLKAGSSGDVLVNYKPLARKRKGKVRHTKSAKRLLKRMSKGKVLRRGKYRLTFAAHVQTQTSPKKTKKKYFRFYFRVNK